MPTIKQHIYNHDTGDIYIEYDDNSSENFNITALKNTEGGSAVWGDLTGLLSNQTDLQSALDAKSAGAPSSTDNAIPKFDGVTGKVTQDTSVIIDDNNVVRSSGLVIPDTQSAAIRVNTTNPVYTWDDLLGSVVMKASGPTAPSYEAYNGTIPQYRFAVGNEMTFDFHILHDWLPNSDCFVHIHWSVTDTNTETYTFDVDAFYGKGHSQSPVTSTISTSVVDTAPGVARQIMVSEIQLSSLTPSGTLLDSSLIEPDGTIFLRTAVSSITGAGSAPFIHHVDIHYQSTNIGTVNKAPSFWGV